MVLLGPVRLEPSRWARLALGVGLPLVVLLLLHAAWLAGSLGPLWVLPGVVAVGWVAARTWDRVRGLELRARALLLDFGDGRFEPVEPAGEARISALAVTLPCRRRRDGRRLRLNVWCDAVDATTYRRLARIARHGRWPLPDRERSPLRDARTASGDCR